MNEPLFMVIIDKKPGSEKSLIPQIEYAPFHPEKNSFRFKFMQRC